MKRLTLSFVIPLFNERESLRELVSQIETVSKKQRYVHEYIFVDDGSTDGSFEELKCIKRSLRSRVTIIRFRKNSGKSVALSQAFRLVSHDIVVTLDADLQDDPMELPKVIQLLSRGADMVVGWRKKRQDHRNKLRWSYLFNHIVARAFGVHLHDMNCGMKVMRKSVTDTIDVYGELHRFIPVLAAAEGFSVAEAEIVHHERKYGVSKFGWKRIVRAPFDLLSTFFLTSFRTRPLQMFGPIGVGLIALGSVVSVYLSILHFLGESIGRRPLLLLGILLIVSGIQVLSTGLIGELVTKATIHREKGPIDQILQ